MRTRGTLHGALVAALGIAASGGAFASACSGPSPFTDIPQSAIYCTDAEWLANRGITLGCGGTNFCPADVVSRGSMALFMQRLGSVLSPTFLTVDVGSGAIDLDAPQPIIACQTADFTPTGYPRTVRITTTFTGYANAALSYVHEVYLSMNGGATWNPFSGSSVTRNGTGDVRWISSNAEASIGLVPSTIPIRWGVRLGRATVGGGTGDFSSIRCFINVEINSATSVPLPPVVTSTLNDR